MLPDLLDPCIAFYMPLSHLSYSYGMPAAAAALILHYLEQVPHRDMPPSLLPTGAATTVKRPREKEVSCYDSQPLFHILGLVVRQIILIFM